jgi:predicted ATPase
MIKSVRIRNFKAIRDSKTIRFSDLAVFIGNNGSGKSSVFEALQFLQTAFRSGLDKAFEPFGDLDNIRHNQSRLSKEQITEYGFRKLFEPVEMTIIADIDKKRYTYTIAFNTTYNGDFVVVEHETLRVGKDWIFESVFNAEKGFNQIKHEEDFAYWGTHINPGELYATDDSINDEERVPFVEFIVNCQFLNLNANTMGYPAAVDRINPTIRLVPDGRNIAEFVRQLAKNPDRLNVLIDKMRFVLPYASDVQTYTTDDFDRRIQLRLYEAGQRTPIPGWLFSSGTLRILALLAVLNQPELPSVLFIDEIENGLDPRTIGLLTEEIRQAVQQKKMQVMATTHSPYFLDLLDLKHIIVTERQADRVVFIRPDTDESLTLWKERFSPGKLYTMGRLTS